MSAKARPRKPARPVSKPVRSRRRDPFDRAAATFVASLSDSYFGWRVVLLFVVAHVVAWTEILTQLKAAQDVHMDVAEAFAWGQKFEWGYGKHPPLSGWIAGLWFDVFPVADWATYALAMTTLGCSLLICWRIALRVVDPRRAFLTVVMLALYPIFNFKGYKYNADLLQLVTLPWVVLAYLNLFEKRTVLSGIWLGIAAAAALMTKYWVLTMFGAIGLAALIHPERLNILRSPAPWIALVVLAVLMIPHVMWLRSVEFAPIVYADDVYGSPGRALSTKLVGLYVGQSIGLWLPVLLLTGAAIAWRRGWWRAAGAGLVQRCRDFVAAPWVRGVSPAVNAPQALNIWLIQAIVAAGPPLAGLVLVIYMKTDWGIPLFFLVALSFVAIPVLRIRRTATVRLVVWWFAITLAMLVAAPIIAAHTVRQDAEEGVGARSQFAAQLTQAWRLRFGTRWAVVAATTSIGEPMTFYSPDHPAPLTPGEVWSSGLTSLDEARRLGFIGICDTLDGELQKCLDWMATNAKGAEQVTMTQRRFYQGIAGPAVTWKVYIMPPAK